MGLSSELISQFAKITNDEKPKKSEEVTLYGEVVELEEMICVRFDGAEELTPVTTIVEKDNTGEIVNYKYGAASVKSGDRVSVSLKNHSATITGNLSDPPAGRAEFKVNEDSILARVGATEMWIKEEGVTFKGLSDGTTVIDGGCIKTGTIDAKYLNLTGAISFGDLKDAATKQQEINSISNTASSALNAANSASSTADSALAAANNALVEAQSITIPKYIKSTYIDSTTIESPTITGNDIKVYGTFQTIGYDGVNQLTTGYIGAAAGKLNETGDSLGIAMARTWGSGANASYSYVIVTNAGVRLQFAQNSVVVSRDGIYLRAYDWNETDEDGSVIATHAAKAYYDKNGVRTEIGSGSGGTATFG